jgi:hypothetical protein
MTVAAWDGRTLAADKMTDFGGLHATTTKIRRLSGGRLAVGCGAASIVAEVCAWLNAGADPAAFPEAQRSEEGCSPVLVVQPGGALLQYERSPHPVAIENPFWAIGSGRDFAMMAMRLGKTAAEAVALTAELCNNCGNGVDVAVAGGATSSSAAGAPAAST